MPHRVFVTEVETPEDPQLGRGSFLYVCRRATKELGNGIPKRLHKEIEGLPIVPRLDLCLEQVFQYKKQAVKQMKRLCNRLRNQGHEVNPWEPVYSLYVIELRRPQGHQGKLPPIYVGQTSIPVEDRFAQHVAGGRLASGKVTGNAVKLRPDLVPDVQLFSRKNAESAETRLGQRLQAKGYKVYGPQNLKAEGP